jgi:hypothetical protein
MHFQEILAEAHARADANDDGKLTMDDIDELAREHKLSPELLDKLKAKVDANADGKLDPADIGVTFGSAGDTANHIQHKLFGH